MKITFTILGISIALIFTFAQTTTAQWTQANGPDGGIIPCLATDSSGVIYAGTSYSGVFVSTDGGTSWKQKNSGLKHLTVSSLSAHGNTVYAGTNGEVYMSTDYGATWKPVLAGKTGLNVVVNSIVINDSGDIFAGSIGSGIFLFNNRTKSWKQINQGLPENANIMALVKCGNSIFACDDFHSTYLTINNGDDWVKVGPNSINSLFVQDTTIYAGADSIVYCTNKSGTNWKTIGFGLPEKSDIISLTLSSGGDLFASTFKGIYVCPKNEKNWTKVSGGVTPLIVNYLIVSDTNILAGTWDGVLRSTNNGHQWHNTSKGITDIGINSFTIYDSSLFAATNRGIFVSKNNGIDWTVLDSGNTSHLIRSIHVISNRLFTGSDIYILDTNNAGWTKILNPLHIYATCFAECGRYFFTGTGESGVYFSMDSGTTWKKVNSSLSDSMIYSLCVNDKTIFAGTLHGIFTSADYGKNWHKVTKGVGNCTIFSLTVCNGTVFAGTENGIFLSSNNGESWNKVKSNLFDNALIQSIAVSGTSIFAGTDSGVFHSNKNGTDWETVNTGLANTSVRSLFVCNGKLYAGTYTGGIWYRPISEILKSGTECTLEVLKKTTINFSITPSKASPNFLSFKFNSPVSEKADLSIYTLSGHKIKSFDDLFIEPGFNYLTWDTRNIATGYYTMNIRVGAKSFVRTFSIFH